MSNCCSFTDCRSPIHLQINEFEEHAVAQGELDAQKQNSEREEVNMLKGVAYQIELVALCFRL